MTATWSSVVEVPACLRGAMMCMFCLRAHRLTCICFFKVAVIELFFALPVVKFSNSFKGVIIVPGERPFLHDLANNNVI